MTTTKIFHWFWAWEDEKEEAWLREMSQTGQHFRSVSPPSTYIFEKGEPIDYVYRLDYFTNRKDRSNYLQIFQDDGWDYKGEMGGWQYFCQESINGELPEIYTDNNSKSKKYERIMLFLIIFFPIFMNTIILVSRGARSGIILWITWLMGTLMLFYAYGMVRLLHRIIQLRKRV